MEFAIASLIILGGIPFLWMVGYGIGEYLATKNKKK